MIISRNIYESSGLILRNLNLTATHAKGTWVSGTGYGFYGTTLEKPVDLNHYYYMRFYYKFTTTNQSPTWVTYYMYGGMQGTNATLSGPVANTEYLVSGISSPNMGATNNPKAMTIYNGNSNAISGVTSYVKDVLVYDVTDLFNILKARGAVTNTSNLKTWCDSNLEYSPCKVDYDVTSLIGTNSNLKFLGGNIFCKEIIEPDGMRRYSVSDTLRNNCWFDTGSGVTVYNNEQNGTVSHTRISASSQGSPFASEHPYILQITTNGTASPYSGGFVATHYAAVSKVFIERFVAKVPMGYSVTFHYNSQGSGSSVKAITPLAGTGDWEEYAILYRCGTSGSFSTGGHIALSGSDNTSVTWYLAYANNCDITGHEDWMNYRVLPKKSSTKGGNLFTNEFDTVNLLTSYTLGGFGDWKGSSWTIDTEDYAGRCKFSIVQPVGASSAFLGPAFPINPMKQYKLSYWVKCKGDMTSFLTAICYGITESQAQSGGLNHQHVHYKSGTKTRLSAALNTGDTQMTVESNANWSAYSYSRLGFRSNYYNSSYHDLGVSNGYNSSTGLIKGVSGSNIVTFNTAYTGSAMASGTCVAEAYDGGTWPYPIGKGNLPTDNTWKYCEGYFGSQDLLWDGNNYYGQWGGIPSQVRYARLYINIYANNGTVPIKWSDVRITPVSIDESILENKVMIC